ncbi:MFS transporter [Sulfitobacter sp. D35]|nr:MFS transporter [Sulfitobacter sp. D35]MDW4500104.1 MFS transporter [Sulfitobacter sp. D35]
MLSAAGLPIYIHAPKVYADEYGVSLAALGAVLAGLRLIDVVQDPLLGRLSEHLRPSRGSAVALACAVIAVGMVALFALPPALAPLVWFAISLTVVFSAFSFLTINFYAQGVVRAGDGHLRLARWRETGALVGICVASVAPLVLGYAGYAVAFALLAVCAWLAMRGEWVTTETTAPSIGLRAVLGDGPARHLLLIALVNAAPVAVTSTLFLFFVQSRLEAPGLEGPLLLAFFLAAALAAPGWGALAERYGARATLGGAMLLAIAAFAVTLTLGPGDWPVFAAVCLVSGAALGADLTLLPAMFAARMARISPSAAEGFGLWSFVSKLTLALAAGVLLPLLGSAGFDSGSGDNPDAALALLTLLYAGVPCLLKAVALGLLLLSPREATA